MKSKHLDKEMIFFIRIGLLIGLGISGPLHAQDRPYQLVCFGQDGIEDTLNKVVNAQQFLRNDSTLKSGSCDFAQLPAGSSARFIDIHSSPKGFLYPIYRVTYATTGQRMYAADGVFRSDQWNVRRLKGSAVQLITPKSCVVLDGYTNVAEGFFDLPEN